MQSQIYYDLGDYDKSVAIANDLYSVKDKLDLTKDKVDLLMHTLQENARVYEAAASVAKLRKSAHVALRNLASLADIEDVKEDEKGYPQPTNWKELPSSALFIRHAKNVTIQGLLIGSEATDPRVPIIAHDVEGLSIKNTRVTKNNTAKTFFQGKEVKVYEVEKPLGWEKQVVIIRETFKQ
jgi:hypothetical protein